MDVASLAIQIKTGDVQKGVKELDKLTEAGKDAEKATNSLSLAYGAAAGAITAAVIAIGRASINAALEAEQAQNKMVAVLRATGYAAGLTASELNEMADSMAAATRFDDESIRNASAVLLTFRNVQGETFKQGISLAADLASVLGTDLNSAALQVGKALNDPVQGVTALSRAGVQFSEVQKDQIKKFVETNQLVKAQEIVLGELTAQVGGTAEAMNTGLTKATTDLGKAFDELFESLGKSSEVQGTTIFFAESLSSVMRTLTDEINKTGGAWSGFVNTVFKPFDLNLLGFQGAAPDESQAESNRLAKASAMIGKERQLKQQADDAAAAAKKISDEKAQKEAERAAKELAAFRKQMAEMDMRGWVEYADAVLADGERIADIERKQILDKLEEEKRAENEFNELRIKMQRQRVMDESDARFKAIDEQEKAQKKLTDDIKRDLTSALARAFESGKDPAAAFTQGLASTIFSRVSAALADALITGAMNKMGGGGGGGTDLFGSILGIGAGLFSGSLTAAFSQTTLGASGFGSGLAYGNQDLGMNFEGGGFTGSGSRSGGIDGKGGFMAMLHPNETVIDHTKGSGSGQIVYAPVINIDSRTDRGEVMRLVQNAVQNGNNQLVDRLQRQGRI